MAKIYEQFRYSLVKKLTDIHLKVAIGAAGAPTLDASASKGVSGIVHNGAGDYTITFTERYYALVMAQFMLQAAAAEDLQFQIVAVSLSAKTVQILCTAAGVAADPSNGSTVYGVVSFQNCSV
jgi:hypothetical protein